MTVVELKYNEERKGYDYRLRDSDDRIYGKWVEETNLEHLSESD